MAGEIGYINLTDADAYFNTRLAADVWNDITDDSTHTTKTAALMTAYDRLFYSGLFDLPLFASATAAELVILKKAQCEMALYMLIHLEDEDRRKGLQAQGVTVAGIVKETYKDTDLNYLPIPPIVAGMLDEFSTAATHAFYAADLDRDEDKGVNEDVTDF
jgi:hypothetical protein